jgi:plasmid stability protein
MYLTDEQRKRLKQRATDAGVSEAEVIRSILDESLGIDDGTDDLLAAIEATFGICIDYPDWPEWLREMRGRTANERLKELGL